MHKQSNADESCSARPFQRIGSVRGTTTGANWTMGPGGQGEATAGSRREGAEGSRRTTWNKTFPASTAVQPRSPGHDTSFRVVHQKQLVQWRGKPERKMYRAVKRISSLNMNGCIQPHLSRTAARCQPLTRRSTRCVQRPIQGTESLSEGTTNERPEWRPPRANGPPPKTTHPPRIDSVNFQRPRLKWGLLQDHGHCPKLHGSLLIPERARALGGLQALNAVGHGRMAPCTRSSPCVSIKRSSRARVALASG